MTDEHIKTVVNETIDQLLGNSMIKYSDLVIYDRMSERLREHYKEPKPLISHALNELIEHPYYDVLEMYYKKNMTLEAIAEEYDVDISTIVRNKKALCIKIFKLIN